MNKLPITNKNKWHMRQKDNYVIYQNNSRFGFIIEAVISTGFNPTNLTNSESVEYTTHKRYNGNFRNEGINIFWNYLIFDDE